LSEAFNEDKDIHTQTAMDVFQVARDDVDGNMRRQAKAVNFGIIYGISSYGLSQNLGISRKDAQDFIDQYLAIYPKVKEYMDSIVKEAKHQGLVTTIMNRRRYLPDITSRNFNQRSFAERTAMNTPIQCIAAVIVKNNMDSIVKEAKNKGFVTTIINRRRYLPDITSRNFNQRSFDERTAMNTPIQGSAADIIKKAMIDLQRELKNKNFKANLLLQVHDELILEVPKDELDAIIKLVPEVMENTIQLDVPLKADHSYGASWFDAK